MAGESATTKHSAVLNQPLDLLSKPVMEQYRNSCVFPGNRNGDLLQACTAALPHSGFARPTSKGAVQILRVEKNYQNLKALGLSKRKFYNEFSYLTESKPAWKAKSPPGVHSRYLDYKARQNLCNGELTRQPRNFASLGPKSWSLQRFNDPHLVKSLYEKSARESRFRGATPQSRESCSKRSLAICS